MITWLNGINLAGSSQVGRAMKCSLAPELSPRWWKRGVITNKTLCTSRHAVWPSNYNLPSPVVIWYTINIQVAREGIYKSVKAVCHGASSTMTLNRIDAAGLQRVRLQEHACIHIHVYYLRGQREQAWQGQGRLQKFEAPVRIASWGPKLI